METKEFDFCAAHLELEPPIFSCEALPIDSATDTVEAAGALSSRLLLPFLRTVQLDAPSKALSDMQPCLFEEAQPRTLDALVQDSHAQRLRLQESESDALYQPESSLHGLLASTQKQPSTADESAALATFCDRSSGFLEPYAVPNNQFCMAASQRDRTAELLKLCRAGAPQNTQKPLGSEVAKLSVAEGVTFLDVLAGDMHLAGGLVTLPLVFFEDPRSDGSAGEARRLGMVSLLEAAGGCHIRPLSTAGLELHMDWSLLKPGKGTYYSICALDFGKCTQYCCAEL